MKRQSKRHHDPITQEDCKPILVFVALLKDCAKKKDVATGATLHADILKRRLLEKSPYVTSTLINMYAECGTLAKAQEVLESAPFRDVVSWSALISGYARKRQGHEALNCFERMQREGLSPDAVAFTSALKACGSVRAIEKGKQIHKEILNMGLLKKDTMLGNALVDMYAKCGLLDRAEEVLKGLPVQDAVSWNTLIAGFAQQEQYHDAINCYDQMQRECFSPGAVTFTCILKACGSINAVDKGKRIHNEIVNRGLLEKNVVLGTALVDMYAKCGALSKAQRVHEELFTHDIVSWSALISGYVNHGQAHEALHCYEKMQSEGISPNVVTYISILKACSCTRDLNRGKDIHKEIVNRGCFGKDSVLGNVLIDMYVKCGLFAKAREVLEELPSRDVVSWSTLIAGLVQWGQCDMAINCFEQMQGEGFSPNAVTFVCILRACSDAGAIRKGMAIHDNVVSKGLLEKDILLGTALIDMYAKCGELVKAHQVLQELPVQNVASWNALIAGLADRAQGQEALSCLRQMQNEGVYPNETTILCLLNACSHSGLVDEAQSLFMNMTTKYGLIPSSEHHACMVVGFGCAGQFDKAVSVINVMPSYEYPAVWLPLLAACRKWGYVKLGMSVFDQMIQLGHSCSVAYVLLSNIFTASGMQEDAENVEAMRLKYSS